MWLANFHSVEGALDDRAEAKCALRAKALAARDALDAEWRAEASVRIAERALTGLSGAQVVGAYLPIRSEVDPRPLMRLIAKRDIALCVPAIVGHRLEFRELAHDAALEPQGLGTHAPGASARVLRPELLLVPLAGFDRRGHRLGYGRGFYDRAIARLLKDGAPLTTVGLAFAAQEVEAVPDDPFDIALDAIVTEQEWVRPTAG